MSDLLIFELSLQDSRHRVRILQIMQMRPGLSPRKLEFLQKLEQSARALVKVRLAALERERAKQRI
jgi:hypothetical protein